MTCDELSVQRKSKDERQKRCLLDKSWKQLFTNLHCTGYVVFDSKQNVRYTSAIWSSGTTKMANALLELPISKMMWEVFYLDVYIQTLE